VEPKNFCGGCVFANAVFDWRRLDPTPKKGSTARNNSKKDGVILSMPKTAMCVHFQYIFDAVWHINDQREKVWYVNDKNKQV
jgi:hypothetical protein